MKKFLVIFGIFCLITNCCYSAPNLSKIIDNNEINDAGYHELRNCKLQRNTDPDEDNWLLVPEKGTLKDYAPGYNVNNGACSDYGDDDVICVAGYSKHTDFKERKNTCYKASRKDWITIGIGNDNWHLDDQTPLPDCPLNPWTKEGDTKIAVFVDKNDKIITSKDGRPARSLNTSGNNVRENPFNAKCVAYICQDPMDDTVITYGEADGSCPTGPTTPDTPDTPDNPDNPDTPDNPDNPDDPTPTPTPTDVKHTGTVVPYMDALKSCAGK